MRLTLFTLFFALLITYVPVSAGAPAACASVVTRAAILSLAKSIEGSTAAAIMCVANGMKYPLMDAHLVQAMKTNATLSVLAWGAGKSPLETPAPGVTLKIWGTSVAGYMYPPSSFTQGTNGSTAWGTRGNPPNLTYTQWAQSFGARESKFSWVVENGYLAPEDAVSQVYLQMAVPYSGNGYPNTSDDPNTFAPPSTSNPAPTYPIDPQVNCSIIDIPCNLRKVFIPTASFMQSKLTNLTESIGIGITIRDTYVLEKVVPSWNNQSPATDMTLDFSLLVLPAGYMAVIGVVLKLAAFFWLLGFMGLPTFRGVAGGMIADSSGSEKMAKNNAAHSRRMGR